MAQTGLDHKKIVLAKVSSSHLFWGIIIGVLIFKKTINPKYIDTCTLQRSSEPTSTKIRLPLNEQSDQNNKSVF